LLNLANKRLPFCRYKLQNLEKRVISTVALEQDFFPPEIKLQKKILKHKKYALQLASDEIHQPNKISII